MKSLITGGAGFIGSNLVDVLIELGHEVIVINNEIANAISENQINIPARIGESRTTLANNGKLRTIFGWRPQVNLMDWIKTQ